MEVLNMALMEDVRVGLVFPDLRHASTVCPMPSCTSLRSVCRLHSDSRNLQWFQNETYLIQYTVFRA